MKTLAVANHKGGVGKTATAHALGVGLTALGWRVLLVDTDPQASLTQACGVGDVSRRSLAEVLGGANPGELALSDIIINLDDRLSIAPADIALAAVELGLTSRLGRENVLKKALASVSGFDLVIIDCPPSLGLLTVGSLVAADAVLIPTQPQAVDLRGLRIFMDTLIQLRDELNPDLEILGVLITFYDNRLNHHKAALEAMQSAGLPIMTTKIGRSVRVAEAAGAAQSVITFEPQNPQAENYNQLAEEIGEWLKRNKT
jgi:chromosome partitioning protein